MSAIKPVENEQDYNQALERIQELWTVAPETDEASELKLLLALVELYESKNFPIESPDILEYLKYALDQKKATRADLISVFGAPGRLSEALNGKRALSVNQARKLCLHFSLPMESMTRYFLSGYIKPVAHVATPALKRRNLRHKGGVRVQAGEGLFQDASAASISPLRKKRHVASLPALLNLRKAPQTDR